MALILASTSPIRSQMLDAAGVAFEAVPPELDEEPFKLRNGSPRELPLELAEAKALKVSQSRADDWVIGSDSVVICGERGLCSKPRDRADAAAQLRTFSDRPMKLISAVALARNGEIDWSVASVTELKVRKLSDEFIEQYLEAEWPAVAYTVGVFRMEGRGVQLFDWINGDYFTILGMPLLPLLQALRHRGLIPA